MSRPAPAPRTPTQDYHRLTGNAVNWLMNTQVRTATVVLVPSVYSAGALADTVININSATYTSANSPRFLHDLDTFPFAEYRIVGYGYANAAAETVTLQLATAAAPATPIHSGGDDFGPIPNSLTGIDTGWLTRDDGATGLKEYVVALKGSTATVDLGLAYLQIMLRMV